MSTSLSARSTLTRRQRRALMIAAATAILCLAVLLVLRALRDSVVFFHTPSEAIAKHVAAGTRIRLGGLVAAGSLRRAEGTTVTFAITDGGATIRASYTGILPDLFREGQGVVAEGNLDACRAQKFYPGRHAAARKRDARKRDGNLGRKNSHRHYLTLADGQPLFVTLVGE